MIVVMIVLAVLCASVLIGLFIPYYIVFFSPHRKTDEIEREPFLDDMEMFNGITEQAKKLSKIPCCRVQTTSYDGLRLLGRYYHRSDDAPLCICFHGYRSSAIFDFSIMGQFLQNEGCNVLLVDQRAHSPTAYANAVMCFRGLNTQTDALEMTSRFTFSESRWARARLSWRRVLLCPITSG